MRNSVVLRRRLQLRQVCFLEAGAELNIETTYHVWIDTSQGPFHYCFGRGDPGVVRRLAVHWPAQQVVVSERSPTVPDLCFFLHVGLWNSRCLWRLSVVDPRRLRDPRGQLQSATGHCRLGLCAFASERFSPPKGMRPEGMRPIRGATCHAYAAVCPTSCKGPHRSSRSCLRQPTEPILVSSHHAVEGRPFVRKQDSEEDHPPIDHHCEGRREGQKKQRHQFHRVAARGRARRHDGGHHRRVVAAGVLAEGGAQH